MRVPFIDMAAELAPLRHEIEGAIGRVLDSGTLIGGPEVTAFERELAAACGASHAVGVSSGTDALLVTLLALGISAGDEVVTTPFTFFATAGAPARLGARLVFADIDETTLTLDPRAAIAACTDRTRAIITVNLFGRPAELAPAPCAVIEDSAQSIGAGPPRGIAAALSFFPTKNLGALGDAGAVLTDDAELADRITLLRSHGARPKYHHVAVGGNFRLDALQAAVLRVKLRDLAHTTAQRRARADLYRAQFAAAHMPPELRLLAPHPQHVYNQFVIRAPRRDGLRDALAAAGVATEVYYPEPLHLQPCFAALGYRQGQLPLTERACADALALPIQPPLSADEQAHVVDTIERYYR